MLSVNQLDSMNQMEINKIDRNALVDINTIKIDTSLPASQRMQKYLEEVKNPYCFLCGDTPVQVCFSPEGQELGTKLKNFFISSKKAGR